MGENNNPVWYQLGRTESGESIVDLLLDSESERLEEELDTFPDHLLSHGKSINRQGTLLQIAVEQAQAKSVAVLIRHLLDNFKKAQESNENDSSFIQWIDGKEYPRVLNEDPVGIGDVTILLQKLEPEERTKVATALLPAREYFWNSVDAFIIGLCVDSFDASQSFDPNWTLLEKWLKAVDLGAYKCAKEFRLSAPDDSITIHEVAKLNHPNAIKHLVREGYEVNERDNRGCTALHVAARHGSDKCIEALLKLGSNPFCENNDGETALTVAIKNSNAKSRKETQCASLLLRKSEEASKGYIINALRTAIQCKSFSLASTILELRKIENPVNTYDPLNPLAQETIISDELCQWLFALLELILSASDSVDATIMPLLTIEDFHEASNTIGLNCESPEVAMVQFIESVETGVKLYHEIFTKAEVFTAPLCLLFCATSVAVAITGENHAAQELHPQMRKIFKTEYHNGHLGTAWENMRHWLQNHGLKLAWPSENYRNVGPPLYHAIWRPSDRQSLFDALGTLGVNTSKLISHNEMEVFLQRKIHTFSRRIQTMFVNQDRDAVIASACAGLSISRSGRQSRTRNRGSTSLWCTLSWHRDTRTHLIDLYATLPCSEGMPDELSINEDYQFSSNGDVYQPIRLESDWLDERNTIQVEEGFCFKIPDLSEPIIFSAIGDKSHLQNMIIGEKYFIICPKGQKENVKSFLEQIQNDNIQESCVTNFNNLVALGPFVPKMNLTHEMFTIVSQTEIVGELVNGLKLEGTKYHHLALPSVRLKGCAKDAKVTWLIDERESDADKSVNEEGEFLYTAPPGNNVWSSYKLLVNGNEVSGAQFSSTKSIARTKDDDQTLRWPLMVDERDDYVILGACGEATSLSLTGRSPILTTHFNPCWAIGTSIKPLKAVIGNPDDSMYDESAIDKLKRIVPNVKSGDAMSRGTAERSWENYRRKLE